VLFIDTVDISLHFFQGFIQDLVYRVRKLPNHSNFQPLKWFLTGTSQFPNIMFHSNFGGVHLIT